MKKYPFINIAFLFAIIPIGIFLYIFSQIPTVVKAKDSLKPVPVSIHWVQLVYLSTFISIIMITIGIVKKEKSKLKLITLVINIIIIIFLILSILIYNHTKST